MLLSTVAAVGHTDEILGLLAQNRQLKYDQCGFSKIQDMIGMVEITHPGFDFKFSLRDGSLYDNIDGQSVWRVFLTEKATANAISELGLMPIRVFLAGVSHYSSVRVAEANGAWFLAMLNNGTKISYHFHHGSYHRLSEDFLNADVTVDFPLSCVRGILEMLGVHV